MSSATSKLEKIQIDEDRFAKECDTLAKEWIRNLSELTDEELLWLGLTLSEERSVGTHYHLVKAWGLAKEGRYSNQSIKEFVKNQLEETKKSFSDDVLARENLYSLAQRGFTIASLKKSLQTLHEQLENAMLPRPMNLPTLGANVDDCHTEGSQLAFHLLTGYELGLASHNYPDLNSLNLVYDHHFAPEWKATIEASLQGLPYSKTIFLIIHLLKRDRFQAVDAFNMLTAATVLSGKEAGFELNSRVLTGLTQDPDPHKSPARKLREVHLMAAGFDPKTQSCSCGAKATSLVPLADHLTYDRGEKCQFRHDLLTKTDKLLKQQLVEMASQFGFSINHGCWGCGKHIPKAATHQELMDQPAYTRADGKWNCDFCSSKFKDFQQKRVELSRKGIYINPPAPFNCETCQLDYCTDCLSCNHSFEKVEALEAAKCLNTHEVSCDLCRTGHIDWSRVEDKSKWTIRLHPDINGAICRKCRESKFPDNKGSHLTEVNIEDQLEEQTRMVCAYRDCKNGVIPDTRRTLYTSKKHLRQCKKCLATVLCEKCYSDYPSGQPVD
ncbi:hypothetical protein M3P05_16595 [Sansalvadorimonas sp. 2012CJ34-2]|uniref:Uncharacterized protein n=1 Tax=Parendozoicomonas callyspongiae TaxID=2942213 RepID=A0ABT0PJT7_9GAMM|nr:hypothetical protein [Sansalvadorimonas sp. 2012CJ34-2]MCL6271536.1 hypothetical protein [Sansalvadorimonas sp. 2012CJ34-2]